MSQNNSTNFLRNLFTTVSLFDEDNEISITITFEHFINRFDESRFSCAFLSIRYNEEGRMFQLFSNKRNLNIQAICKLKYQVLPNQTFAEHVNRVLAYIKSISNLNCNIIEACANHLCKLLG